MELCFALVNSNNVRGTIRELVSFLTRFVFANYILWFFYSSVALSVQIVIGILAILSITCSSTYCISAREQMSCCWVCKA